MPPNTAKLNFIYVHVPCRVVSCVPFTSYDKTTEAMKRFYDSMNFLVFSKVNQGPPKVGGRKQNGQYTGSAEYDTWIRSVDEEFCTKLSRVLSPFLFHFN